MTVPSLVAHPCADPQAPDFPSDATVEGWYVHHLLADPGGSLSLVSATIAALRLRLLAALDGSAPLAPDDERRTWRRLYREVYGYCRRRGRAFIETVRRSANERPTVVFILPWPHHKFYRVAMALRARGVGCYLVALRHDSGVSRVLAEQNYAAAFDGIHEVRRNGVIVAALLRQLSPHLFHTHWEPWTAFMVRTVLEHRRRRPCVVEMEDIFTLYAEREAMHRAWSRDAVDAAYWMEGYACRHADGIVYSFAPGVQAWWQARHGVTVNGLHFPCYPAPVPPAENRKDSCPDGVLRVAWAGNVWLPTPEMPEHLFPSAGLAPALAALLEQGIGCDIVVDPGRHGDFSAPTWSVYRDLQRFAHFRLEKGVPLAALPARLARADFGMQYLAYDPTQLRVRPEKLSLQMTTKLFAYLEAGLPVVVNREFTFIAELVERHGLGVVASLGELMILGDRLRAFDRDGAMENVRRYCRDHGMEREIERLISYYGTFIRPSLRHEIPRN